MSDEIDLPPQPDDPDDPIRMAKVLFEGIHYATVPYRMEYEFLGYVLQGLGVTMEKLQEAMFHANCEWDL